MKKYLFLFLAISILSCSTRKDAFVNRNWHTLNTKYNVLYNGHVAFESALKELNDKYEDNYWETLPIEPLKVDKDKVLFPGMENDIDQSSQAFEKAEEKAVKAIQKHSMNIRGHEKNRQIDDAYLLLGKGRYYSQRFVPALEAFTYVLENYPNASLINDTKIWRAKTNIRLQNEERAIEDLIYLLKKEDLPENILEDAHTAMAMAYKSLDSVEAVIKHLNLATVSNKNREQQARNLYVLGQLYRNESKIDSSQIAFQKIIEAKKIPRKYKIYAHVEKAKNYTKGDNAEALLATLAKLIKDRDNRPYLDALHYQVGMVNNKQGNTALAATHFDKSIHAKQAGQFQKGLSYEALGNIKFDKARFLEAGAYYDSVLAIVENPNTKRIRKLIRKRTKLDDVITFEGIITKNDSILNLASMSKEAQKELFSKYIEKLKAQAEKEKIIAENTSFSGSNATSGQQAISGSSSKGKWYFYNVQSVGFGQQDFKKRWGNRPLEDNWRLSDKSQIKQGKETTTNATVAESEKYDIDYYLSKIPNDAKQLENLSSTRNNAYYQLGLIYKEQFKENKLAIERLEKLLTFSPKREMELPAKYHLYKIYQSMNNAKAAFYKKDIISNYSDSKYASIIQNPEAYIASLEEESQAEKVYKEAFEDYKKEKFEEVIAVSKKSIKRFSENDIIPKFELLKTYAMGKTKGLKSFKEGLTFVVMNYPNTVEGKHAQDVLDTLNGKGKNKKTLEKERLKELMKGGKGKNGFRGRTPKKVDPRGISVQEQMKAKEKDRKALETKMKQKSR